MSFNASMVQTALRGIAYATPAAVATMLAAFTTSPSVTPNSNQTDPNTLGSINIDAGGIVGISVGGFVGALAVGALVFYCCRRSGASPGVAAASGLTAGVIN